MNEELENRLGRTALYLCAARALEFSRDESDRILSDPYAAAFSGSFGYQFLDALTAILPPTIPLELRRTMLADSACVRTRFFDDVVMEQLRRGVQQVVLCGVGGDCRSYRLPFSSLALSHRVHIYQLDLPEVLEYRQKVLRNFDARPDDKQVVVCDIPCDFVQPDARWCMDLIRAGFDSREPALFVLEGLLMYLTEPQVADMLNNVASLAAPSSSLVADVLSEAHFTSSRTENLRKIWSEWSSPVVSGMTQPETVFPSHNFEVLAVKQLGEEGVDYGRIPDASKDYFLRQFPRGCAQEADIPRNLIVVARRVRGFLDSTPQSWNPNELGQNVN